MRRLTFLLLSFVSVLSVLANPVDLQQAREQAAKFFAGRGVQLKSEAVGTKVRKSPSGNQLLYVFNSEGNSGFVIVSGDDRTDAILGYTQRGSFNADQMPPALMEWMEQLSAEIEALDSQPAAASRSASKAPADQLQIHPEIKPLILTTWNQGNNSYNIENTDGIYNIKCPKLEQKLTVDGVQKVVQRFACTGCVATAGAQIMYYYQWPKDKTKVVPGYNLSNSKGADTSKDLPAIQFKWDQMKTSYDSDDAYTVAAQTVAELMLYCGYAANMNYGISGSSASEVILAGGMVDYFDYDPNYEHVMRSNYSVVGWDDLLYSELAQGRPVIYSGSSTGGGHAFICDGYDGAGLYHFNWGWGGAGNGYFKLQVASDYIFDQSMIVGLQPNTHGAIVNPNADDEWEEQVLSDDVPTTSLVSIDEDLTVNIRFINRCDKAFAWGYALGEVMGDGTIVPLSQLYDDFKTAGNYESYKNYDPLKPNYSWPPLDFPFSDKSMPKGTHKLVPISIQKDADVWQQCKPANFWLEVVVDDKNVSRIIAHPVEDVKVNKFEMVTGGTPDKYQIFDISVTNIGDNNECSFALYVDDSYARAKSLKIAAENTKEFRMTSGKLSAGKHTVTLRTTPSDILATLEVDIKQDLAATAFSVDGMKFSGTMLTVDATIENHAGDYIEPLYLFASTDDANKGKFAYVTGSAIIGGGSEDVRFYFQPSDAGTWHLWVTTDDAGTNVIGHTTVDIAAPPTGEVTLELVSSSLVCREDGQATYVMTVKNTGDVTYYRDFRSHLWMPAEGNSWGWNSANDRITDVCILEPGETTTVVFELTGLVDAQKYSIEPYYATVYDAPSSYWFYNDDWKPLTKNFWTEQFTYHAPALIPGDVNYDEKVDIVDVTTVISHILGQTPLIFNAKMADVNSDKVVNIVDVTSIIDLILGKE